MKRQKIKIYPADKWFSIKIRLRDCYENSLYGPCVTCNKTGYWKDYHCGHYMTREKPMTRFHEQNCHMQCPTCNGPIRKGEQGKHGLAIDRLHGKGTAEMLVNLSGIRGAKKHSEKELKRLASVHRLEVKAIAKLKGIEL